MLCKKVCLVAFWDGMYAREKESERWFGGHLLHPTSSSTHHGVLCFPLVRSFLSWSHVDTTWGAGAHCVHTDTVGAELPGGQHSGASWRSRRPRSRMCQCRRSWKTRSRSFPLSTSRSGSSSRTCPFPRFRNKFWKSRKSFLAGPSDSRCVEDRESLDIAVHRQSCESTCDHADASVLSPRERISLEAERDRLRKLIGYMSGHSFGGAMHHGTDP